MIAVSVNSLKGHILNLRLRSTNVNNVKRRIYSHLKPKDANNIADDDGVNQQVPHEVSNITTKQNFYKIMF